MSIFGSDLAELEPVQVGDWHPARYTPSLSGGEDFTSQGDKLLRFVDRHWRSPETVRFLLDAWQQWLIRHVLETYPPDWPVVELRGQLRYRQVVISLGRQNGKSVVAAILALYFLALHVRGPRVLGFASIESQARIVYDRLWYAVENNPALRAEINHTKTRGISRKDNSGMYKTMPAKEESAQGEPVTGAIYDELHLGVMALWEALIKGQEAKINSLLVGITTAGDDDSLLLIKLYEDGQLALDGQDERFGFFVWEAEDEELTEANVIRANPAVACGRVRLATMMAAATKTWRAGPDEHGVPGRDRVIRYTLNRFVRGTADSWVPLYVWQDNAGDGLPAGVHDVVFGIERHQWQYATITATTKLDGRLHTEMVATLVDTSQDELLELALALHGHGGPVAFAMPADTLGPLARALRDRGITVWALAQTEMTSALDSAVSALNRRAVSHAGDELLDLQVPRAKTRSAGDLSRISRTLSTGEIDAVLATVVGLYVADVKPPTDQMF